jgi:iron complex outermembrane receptor protein
MQRIRARQRTGGTPRPPRTLAAKLYGNLAVLGLGVLAAAAQEAPAPEAPASHAGSNGLLDKSIEDLMKMELPQVEGASKFKQRVSDAPASVTVVTSDEIKLYGHKSMADVLRSVRGSFVSYDRNYNYLGLRGFNRPGDFNGRVLILVDGHRINENIFDGALIDNGFIPDIDLVDRVEVIRGPSSSLYGSSAFFGVVNIITKRGRDFQPIEVSVEAGSNEYLKGRFTVGQVLTNGVELMASGTFYDRGGEDKLYFFEFDDPSSNNGIANNRDYARAYNFLSTVSYSDFTLQGAYTYREKGIPTGSYGTVFNHPDARSVDEEGYVDLKFQRQINPNWDVLARANFNYYHFDQLYPLPTTNPPPNDVIVNKDDVDGQWAGGEIQSSWRLLDKHRLILGTEYRENFRQDQLNYNLTAPRDEVAIERNSRNWAFYGQAELALWTTNVVLNAGLRYDHYSDFGDSVNPRTALILHPWQQTTFKLLYGEAFRAPSAFEAYFDSPSFKANPDLQPETIRTYELVYEQELPHHLWFTAAAYRYEIQDLITQTSDPLDGRNVFLNLDEVEANGLELELDGRFPCGARARLSYALQRTEDAQTGAELSNSPQHLAKLNLAVPILKDKVFLGIETQYSSSVTTLTGNEVDSYWLVNATLFSQKIVKGLEASVSVYNIFNEKYGYPGASEHLQALTVPGRTLDVIQQDGRSFRFKFTYRF